MEKKLRLEMASAVICCSLLCLVGCNGGTNLSPAQARIEAQAANARLATDAQLNQIGNDPKLSPQEKAEKIRGILGDRAGNTAALESSSQAYGQGADASRSSGFGPGAHFFPGAQH